MGSVSCLQVIRWARLLPSLGARGARGSSRCRTTLSHGERAGAVVASRPTRKRPIPGDRAIAERWGAIYLGAGYVPGQRKGITRSLYLIGECARGLACAWVDRIQHHRSALILSVHRETVCTVEELKVCDGEPPRGADGKFGGETKSGCRTAAALHLGAPDSGGCRLSLLRYCGITASAQRKRYQQQKYNLFHESSLSLLFSSDVIVSSARCLPARLPRFWLSGQWTEGGDGRFRFSAVNH